MSDTEKKLSYPLTLEKNEEYSIVIGPDYQFSSPEYIHLGRFGSAEELKDAIKKMQKESLKIEPFDAFHIGGAYESNIQDIRVTALSSLKDYAGYRYLNYMNLTLAKKERGSVQYVFPKTFNNEILVRKMQRADKANRKILGYKKLYYSKLDRLDIHKLTEI